MPVLCDYHLHSHHSGDSSESMEAIVLAAIEKGLKYICFTEHNDYGYPAENGDDPETFVLNVDSYLYELLALKEKYQDQIEISFGLEIGLSPENIRKNAILAREHEYDFIIASTHFESGIDPYYGNYYTGRTDVEANRAYFGATVQNVKAMQNFDVVGHLDYVMRYAPDPQSYNPSDYMDIWENLFEFLLENEKGIELNTGGLRSSFGSIHPAVPVIKRYREMGGELITIGSDAHKAADVGYALSEATDVLKELGFKYYSIYQNRIAEYKKIL